MQRPPNAVQCVATSAKRPTDRASAKIGRFRAYARGRRAPDPPSGIPVSFLSETRRRRTFAIISHPDAGKTTLTEKLLLFSGAIQIAGAVKRDADGLPRPRGEPAGHTRPQRLQ